MRSTAAFRTLVCALVATLDACRAELPAPRAIRPNVLFISIDTLRADHLGAYGGVSARTPTIDALADEGALFERAVAHAPMTLPSHASMMTSLYPPGHGVRDNGVFVLEDRQETLAELLRRSGYRTGAFVGAFVLDRQFGLAQGFELYDDDVAGSAENDRPAAAVLASARAWIADVGTDEPWFAFVHLFDPHAPYQAPPPYGAWYADDAYSGEVAYVDAAIGEFLQGLGALDHTLVVVTADHGEGLGDHGERTHGMFAYESTLHVPLIFRLPGVVPARARLAPRVRHIDIAPTVAELVGAEPPASFHGRSLVAMMRGHDDIDRPSYFESLTFNFNYGLAPLRGSYEGRLKFVSLPIPELYDLVDDPGEERNLASQLAGTVRAMADRLREMSETASAEVSANVTTQERLESLGYVSSPIRARSLDEYGPADDPKHWIQLAAMLDEAVAHHRARRPNEAIQLLESIITARADVAIAHTRLARILHEEGRLDEAIAVLEDALANGIEHPNIVTALGALLRETGDEARWSRALEAVTAKNPDDVDAHEALASSLMRRELPERALPHLERVVELDASQYDTLVQIGLILADLGRLEEAKAYMERFVNSAPDAIYAEDKVRVQAFIDELEAIP